MSASKRPLIAALVAALATVPLLAAPVRINLATLAPASTTWHKALLDMGDTWKKTTEGRVSVTVFGGGNLDEETISSTDTQLRYQTALRGLDDKYALLKDVIKGGA